MFTYFVIITFLQNLLQSNCWFEQKKEKGRREQRERERESEKESTEQDTCDTYKWGSLQLRTMETHSKENRNIFLVAFLFFPTREAFFLKPFFFWLKVPIFSFFFKKVKNWFVSKRSKYQEFFWSNLSIW